MAFNGGKVKSVQSADTLQLVGAARPGAPPPERTLSLAYISAPRLRREGDEPWAFAGREFLRKLLVGRQIDFKVCYNVPTLQNREFGIVQLNGQNITEALLREGLVKFREESSKREDADQVLLAAYQAAETQARVEGKGLWGHSEAHKIHVSQETLTDMKGFLSKHEKKKMNAIIEQVRSGDILRVRLMISDKDHQFLNLLIAGIKTPTSTRTTSDNRTGPAAEEFGDEAKIFVESRLIQRAVVVQLVGLNQNETAFIGEVIHPAGSIAEALLSAGLARVVDWQTTMIGAEHMAKLRKAEQTGKDRKVNLWKSHVQKQKNVGGSSDVIVTKIISADTILVRNKEGKESKVQLSSIRQPKATDPKQAAYQAEAKEFMRKKLIGKHVNLSIDYHKAAADQFEERDLATVSSGKDNIARLLVERGYASVIRHRRDDEDRSPIYDELLIAEESAIKEQKGIHNPKSPPASVRVVEASENEKRAKQYLPTLQRVRRVPAIVEFVSSGGRFKLLIPRENARLTFILGGVKVPRTGRSAADQSEPMGQQAFDLATKKCLQRDVEIEVETIDRVGGFVGALYINKTDNFARVLLEEGLATVHEYSAEQHGHGLEYQEAETKAKQAKKGLWANYEASSEQREQAAEDKSSISQQIPAKKEYIDLVVSDVGKEGSFFVQIINDGVKQLEKLMSELQASSSRSPLPTEVPKVGDTVAAQFSEDDAWYRGRIRRVDRDQKKAEVFYYDYGNSESVPFSKLNVLQTKFNGLASQAKEARLSFVDMPHSSSEYYVEAVAYFQQIASKQLVASIDHRDGNIMQLSLYDPDGSTDPSDSLNADFVRHGWGTVVSIRKSTWEKAYGSTLKSLQIDQAEAAKSRAGMFEFGDITSYDD